MSLLPVDEQEVQKWMLEADKVPAWNDVTRLKLFLRAINIIKLLWHEIEVLRAQLEIRNEK